MEGLQLEDPYDVESRDKLKDLPGIRVTDDGRIYGSIDALSAALARLGEPPLKPELPEQVTSLPGLRHYQNEGVARLRHLLTEHRGALLADDMGLGKTRQAIAVATAVCRWQQPTDPGRALICCPASVRETWAQELAAMGVTDVAICRPQGAKGAKEEWKKARTARCVVTSYDLATRAIEQGFSNTLPLLVILDEAHLLKGRKTQRSDQVQALAAMAMYRLAITATPQWDRPRDNYKLLRILFGTRFGSAWDFDIAYCGGKENEHGGLDNKGATRTEELRHRLGFYMVRREKKDVLTELPPLTRQVLWVDAQPKATQWLNTALTRHRAGDVHAAIEATLLGKMPVAIQLAKDAKRFLLFTYLKAHARQMAQLLNEEGTPCVCITGDDTTEKRNALAQLAQAKGQGVVASIDSLSVGVNLQAVAEVGIFHALDYVPQKMAQAEARLHRMGQKNAVTWYWLAMKDSIDEVIVRTVVHKLDQWTEVMGKGGATEIRNKLNAAIGVGEEAEKAALAALYAEMGDE